MPRTIKHFVKVRSLFFAIGLTILSAEILVRSVRPQFTYSRILEMVGEQYSPSNFNPFTLKSNYKAKMPSMEYPEKHVKVTTNSLGLRGKEVAVEKRPGTTRILILGDSYTFGVYVEDWETYSARLEAMLRQEGYDVEVINAGYADGFEADEEYCWLVNRGVHFQPDIIIYGFFTGNDIMGIEPEHWAKIDQRGLPVEIRNEDIYIDQFGRLRSKIKDNKTIGYEAVYQVPILRESHLFIGLSRLIEKIKFALFDRKRTKEGGYYIEGFPHIFKKQDSAFDQKETHFLKIVEGMAEVSSERNAKFLVLMIPINFQVEPLFLPMLFDEYKNKIRSIPSQIARDYFSELEIKLEHQNITYINLLKEMGKNPGKYYPRNGEVHFNPAGHLFVANKIKEFLYERKWLGNNPL